MGANDYNPDFGCTPMEYRQQIDSLIGALGLIDSPTDLFGPHVIRLATQFIFDAQQRPSRREIAAMAMQGLLSCPSYIQTVEVLASTSIKAADALIERLNVDPAEGAKDE
jgi:succinate dehydrogenase/fumarate reductase-like Fe-S protein